MGIVEVWNIPTELVELSGKFGGETRPFEDHWPCYSWYGKSDDLNRSDQVEWINNEKYVWAYPIPMKVDVRMRFVWC